MSRIRPDREERLGLDREEETWRAIRGSILRLSIIGALSSGLSPWVYLVLILFLRRFAGLTAWTDLFSHVHYPIYLLTGASCLVALPAAWIVQRFLGKRARRKAVSSDQEASALVAVGIVSLTVVHIPAAMGLLYFLAGGAVSAAIAVEIWAFVLYLPMQAMTLRPILCLMHKDNRQAGLP